MDAAFAELLFGSHTRNVIMRSQLPLRCALSRV
jgi:hypothetical protein